MAWPPCLENILIGRQSPLGAGGLGKPDKELVTLLGVKTNQTFGEPVKDGREAERVWLSKLLPETLGEACQWGLPAGLVSCSGHSRRKPRLSPWPCRKVCSARGALGETRERGWVGFLVWRSNRGQNMVAGGWQGRWRIRPRRRVRTGPWSPQKPWKWCWAPFKCIVVIGVRFLVHFKGQSQLNRNLHCAKNIQVI